MTCKDKVQKRLLVQNPGMVVMYMGRHLVLLTFQTLMLQQKASFPLLPIIKKTQTNRGSYLGL